MYQYHLDQRHELIAKYHLEAQQARMAAAVTPSFRRRLARLFRQMATRLERERFNGSAPSLPTRI
jgi:hypothetical protein